MRFQFPSLRARLLLVTLLAVLPALGLSLHTAWEQRRQGALRAQENALQLARILSADHERLIEGAHQLLTGVARLPEVRKHDARACSALFRDLLRQYRGAYVNLGAIEPNGDVFCSALPLKEPVNLADRAYFRRAVDARGFALGEYQVGRITGKATINFGHPVLSDAGSVQAVVYAALDLAWLNELSATARLPRGSTLTVIDGAGVILVRFPDSERWIGKSAPERRMVEIQLKQGEGVAEAADVDGIPRLFGFSTLRGTPGGAAYVSIGIPKQAVYAEANQVLARNLVGLGLVGLSVLVASLVFGGRLILRPVQARTGELTRSVEDLQALSEISRVVNSSLDLDQVLNTIARQAVALSNSDACGIFELDPPRHVVEVVASHNLTRQFLDTIRETPVDPSKLMIGRATASDKPVQIADITLAHDYPLRNIAMREGFVAQLAVPIVSKNAIRGAVLFRRASGLFDERVVNLLTALANQSGVAIENARLFRALQARSAELTRSVDELTALGEVNRALSSTLDLETVLDTIVTRANQLAGAAGGWIYEYDEVAALFRLRANSYEDLHDVATLDPIRRATPIPWGQGIASRAASSRRAVQIPDIAVEGAYESPMRPALLEAGYRSILTVPLLLEGRVIGALGVSRKTPGEFSPEIVRLLSTFATQSALAIQNARLFREIAEKSRQLEVASRHKSEFLASMSHELRTPLNAMLGFNEMILGQVYGEVPVNQREPLTYVQSSGKHLLRLINNVLDLSKIEAGRMELALAEYSIQDTVESVRASLRPLAEDKGLEFVATVAADIPLAYGDPGRIMQCLVNLAGNALKFTRLGRVEIAVELRGDLLVYRVADTGIGIAPDKIDALFDEFRQGDPTITSEFGGTGLGLSITRKLVELHKGRIWVDSELGRGSTFFIALPLRVDGGRTA